MKIRVKIAVRNPDWYWKEDDYQEEWIMINEDKESKYLPSVTFGFDKDIIAHEKSQSDQHTFKFKAANRSGLTTSEIQEVTMNGLDVTEFKHAGGSIHVIISKSILHHAMANQNNGEGTFYWYYFIHENMPYVEVQQNIWLSKEHFDELVSQVPNLAIIK